MQQLRFSHRDRERTWCRITIGCSPGTHLPCLQRSRTTMRVRQSYLTSRRQSHCSLPYLREHWYCSFSTRSEYCCYYCQ